MKNPVARIIAVRTVQASLLGWAAHRLLRWPLTGRFALGRFLTPALCVYFVFVFVARWRWGLPGIWTRLPSQDKGEDGQSGVALTFDDGPSPEVTPKILEVLREHGATATFFVLGEAVDRCPDLLRRIAAEGHGVGVHAYSHRPFVLMRGREVEAEIARTQDAIFRACPEAAGSRWLRPPHGFKSPGMLWTLHCLGSRMAAWSVDGRDYDDADAARIARRVLRSLSPGAIVLLHDGPGKTATAAALPLVLREMSRRGLQAVRLPE